MNTRNVYFILWTYTCETSDGHMTIDKQLSRLCRSIETDDVFAHQSSSSAARRRWEDSGVGLTCPGPAAGPRTGERSAVVRLYCVLWSIVSSVHPAWQCYVDRSPRQRVHRRRRPARLGGPPAAVDNGENMHATQRPFELAPRRPVLSPLTPSSVPPSFLPSATTKTTCSNVARMKEIHRWSSGRPGRPAVCVVRQCGASQPMAAAS